MQCLPPDPLVQASRQRCSSWAVAWPVAEYQLRAPGSEPALTASAVLADCRLHICLYYREVLVKELTTSSPEGCRISHGHTYDASSLDQVLFPYPEDNSQRKNIEKLLSHLERGVVLWMAPDGLYAKRLCQSRIYWDGPLALCSDRPNKLERDQTCKLFDTQQFLSGEVERLGRNGVPVRAGPGSVELLMVGVPPARVMAAGCSAGLPSVQPCAHQARPQSRSPVGSPVTPSAGACEAREIVPDLWFRLRSKKFRMYLLLTSQ